jgi:hypothetical protein
MSNILPGVRIVIESNLVLEKTFFLTAKEYTRFSQRSQREKPCGLFLSAENLRGSAGEFFSFPQRSEGLLWSADRDTIGSKDNSPAGFQQSVLR